MAKILRLTDTVIISVGDVKFHISPLSHEKKIELANCTKVVGGVDHYDLAAAQRLYVKYGLKKIEGVEGYEKEPYELQFDENGNLTDDCISEVFSLEQRTDFTVAAWQLLNGMKPLINPGTGKPLKGVTAEVVSKGK